MDLILSSAVTKRLLLYVPEHLQYIKTKDYIKLNMQYVINNARFLPDPHITLDHFNCISLICYTAEGEK